MLININLFFWNEKSNPTNFSIEKLREIDKCGSSASVLFNDVEIVKSSPQYLDKFRNDYSNVFDFNFLNKNDSVNLYNEKKKQESEFRLNDKNIKQKFLYWNQMKKNFRHIKNNLKMIKKVFKLKSINVNKMKFLWKVKILNFFFNTKVFNFTVRLLSFSLFKIIALFCLINKLNFNFSYMWMNNAFFIK